MKKYPLTLLALLLSTQSALAIETSAKQAIIVDDTTGTVLFEKNADEKMHPSSMSKLMTVYIVFSRLKEGSLKLDDTLPVSEKAWRLQGSKSFVELGNRISVDNLLKGIIIQSGNDACEVIAEGLAGSEESFAAQMNDMAKKLGLTNSHFSNPHGLSDPNHLMSARDLATLGHHIIHDFPEYYHYFSEKDFVYHGIKQGNRNVLLYKDLGVDGLKTGHTDEGGYGIVVSGTDKSGRREIIVINGLTSEKERGEEAERLLAFAQRDFENVTLLHNGDEIEKADVWFGEKNHVGLVASKDIVMTLPKSGHKDFKFTVSYNSPLPAPVNKGDHVADLKIESPNAPAQIVPLVAEASVEKQHGMAKMWHALKYYLSGK
jgi:D-alanyl-D-alanine carboxypeptidase (penicillin-binding protein 5/6)